MTWQIRIHLLAAAVVAMLSFAVTHAATFIVMDEGDSGPGTLREAILQANANPGPDDIRFNLPRAGNGTFLDIILTGGTLVVTDSVNIFNSSSQQVTVRRDQLAADFGILEVDADAVVVQLHGLNVFNGASGTGGGLLVNSPTAQVNLSSLYFKDNRATGGAGGSGGAIHNVGELEVTNSTFENNMATGSGGAIANTADGFLDVRQSTFAGNRATAVDGGAIDHSSTRSMTLDNNTFCDNHAAGQGGGIRNSDLLVTLTSNELADNMAPNGPDLRDSGSIITAVDNVIKSPNGQGYMLDATKNQLGTDPLLGTLGPNGGRVPTKGKKVGLITPSIDQGSNPGGFRYDQNGGRREVGAAPDAGATEQGNRFARQDGDYHDPATWFDNTVPASDAIVLVTGDQTVQTTADVTVGELHVGTGNGVNGEGTLEVGGDLTAEQVNVGTADTDQGPFSSGDGEIELGLAASILIGGRGLNVGGSTSEDDDDDGSAASRIAHGSGGDPPVAGRVVAEANGQVNIHHSSATLTVSPFANTAVGTAFAVGSRSDAISVGGFDMTGQSASLNYNFVGQSFAVDPGDFATASVDVSIDVSDSLQTDTNDVGTAFSTGGHAEVTRAQAHFTADMMTSRRTTVGFAFLNTASELAHAAVHQVDYSVTANTYNVNIGMAVGSINLAGTAAGTAHLGDIRVELNTPSLLIQGLTVGTINGSGPSFGQIDSASVVINNSASDVGSAGVGAINLRDGASGVVDNARLEVVGGTYAPQNVPSFIPSLRIATVDGLTAAGQVQTTATVRYQDAQVTLPSDAILALANNPDVAPGSFANATLELVNTEMTIAGDLVLGGGGSVPSNLDQSATALLNPSWLGVEALLMGGRSSLQFTIEGLTRSEMGMLGEYGAIDAENATLDGQLVLDFNFPGVQLGDSFELIRLDPAGTFTDFFDETVIMGLPPGLTAEAAIMGNSLLATVIAIPPLPGDFNYDGVVDAADYTVWRDHLGSAFNLNGNGDETGGSAGVVDQADYDLWVANFGESLPAALQTAAVPEPAAGILTLCLIAGTGAVRSWNRRS